MSAGTVSAVNASRPGAPRTRSISASSRASGPTWRSTKWSGRPRSTATRLLPLFAEERLVCGRVHQTGQLLGVADGQLDHPPLVVGILVDVLGRVAERRVDLDDLPRQR